MVRGGALSALQGYERFSLRLEKRGERVQVGLSWLWSQDAVHSFSLPSSFLAVAANLESAERARRIRAAALPTRMPTDADLARAGNELFEAVFGGDLGRIFGRAREHARRVRKGLALHLQFDPRDQLAQLPWELLHDGTEFLAECADTPLLRVATSGPDSLDASRGSPRVRLLVVTACALGCPALDVDGELARLQRSVGGLFSRYLLEPLPHATLERLEKRLREGPPVEIFHFIGHGAIENGEAALYLEDERDGTARPLSGERLAALLAPAVSAQAPTKRPGLVVLNACDSARCPGPDPWQGIAQSLLKKGIPRVLAMQAAIADAQAVRFAGSFYGAMAKKASPETALAIARRELRLAGNDLSWLLPVLHVSRRLEEPSQRDGWRRHTTALVSSAIAASIVAVLVLRVGLRREQTSPMGRARHTIPVSDEGCPSAPQLGFSFRRVDADLSAGIEKSFCIARTELTRRQYRSLMASQTAGEAKAGAHELTDELPQVDLSPEEERRFLEQLTRVFPGYRFRLPEAVEWRYAASAGRALSSVSSVDQARRHEEANCESGVTNDGFDGLAPVASFPPNAWGLFDVVGNASESVSGEAPPGKRLRLGSSFDSKGSGCGIGAGGPVSIKTKDGETGLRVVAEVVVHEKAFSRDASDPQR